MTSVLVTGVGGTRSLAVVKALRMAETPVRIVGTDCNYFNPGSFQCDRAYTAPLVNEPTYLAELEAIIAKEHIAMVFATTEKEVAFLAEHKRELETRHSVRVIVPEPSVVATCFDKYRTQRFLAEAGFRAIPTIYAGDKAEVVAFAREQGFPLIRKPVFGYGSKGLSLIRNQQELTAAGLDKNYVLQRYIENDDTEVFYNLELNEYTTEIFVNADGSVAGGIVLKRGLRGGETVAGRLIADEAIVAELAKVALVLGVRGPVNFQFRIADGRVWVFEINPLFSGTTAVRAALGFNGVAMAVDSFGHGRHATIAQAELKPNYFLRYFEELLVPPAQLDELRDKGVITHD